MSLLPATVAPRNAPGKGVWSHALVALALALSAIFFARDSRANERVPLQLQAQLVARLSTFDRNFQGRAGSLVSILVVHQLGSAESTFEGAGLAKALSDRREIGGLPVKVEEAEYSDAATIAARCKAAKVAIVYFAVGLEGEMPAVARALAGVDILTAGTSARHAESGAVVGFSLEEARPKIVLNLKQAKAQNVAFKAELLKLARIVE